MSHHPVDQAIERLKILHRVGTDRALARSLGISPTTVSTWRIRGGVPPKYLLTLREEAGPSGLLAGDPDTERSQTAKSELRRFQVTRMLTEAICAAVFRAVDLAETREQKAEALQSGSLLHHLIWDFIKAALDQESWRTDNDVRDELSGDLR